MGSRLVQALEEAVGRERIAAVLLETRSDRPDLRSFYERLGYRVVAEFADYYPDGGSAIRMRHDLGVSRESDSAA